MGNQQSDIDQITVQECLKNNRSAQKRLFDQHAKKMLALCYRYVNDYDTAHDLMQDGFIKVFQNLERFRFESNLGAWIRTIMVNNCLGYLRKEKRLLKSSLDDELQIQSNDANMLDKLEIDFILRSISQLPDTLRTVINMYAIEGYSYSEIAVTLEIEESSVRSHVFRARKHLSYLINKQEGVVNG